MGQKFQSKQRYLTRLDELEQRDDEMQVEERTHPLRQIVFRHSANCFFSQILVPTIKKLQFSLPLL
jgi:hypothetical protein